MEPYRKTLPARSRARVCMEMILTIKQVTKQRTNPYNLQANWPLGDATPRVTHSPHSHHPCIPPNLWSSGCHALLQPCTQLASSCSFFKVQHQKYHRYGFSRPIQTSSGFSRQHWFIHCFLLNAYYVPVSAGATALNRHAIRMQFLFQQGRADNKRAMSDGKGVL